jgi:hypothetical protein
MAAHVLAREFGGEGKSSWYQYILFEELHAHGVPYTLGTAGMIGPAIAKFGTGAQKTKYLPSMPASADCTESRPRIGRGTRLEPFNEFNQQLVDLPRAFLLHPMAASAQHVRATQPRQRNRKSCESLARSITLSTGCKSRCPTVPRLSSEKSIECKRKI